ncbi:MAG TPA: hypothetical protein VGG33_14545 [Polyangia bacterium]
MNQRVPVRFGKMFCSVALAASTVVAMTAVAVPAAFAQPQPAPPAPPAAPPAPAAPALPTEAAPVTYQAPTVAGSPAVNPVIGDGNSDHDSIVGLWGIEARRLGGFRRSAGQDPGCGDPCLADLNSLGVRKWMSSHYAYNLGLAIGVGGGSRRATTGNQTFDTYLGFGPTIGASFLAANWKHLAVSISPQLDAVYFLPSSSGKKSLLINVRSVIEGEVHLGMIGLPAASVAVSTGLTGSFLKVTKGTSPAAAADPDTTSARWSIGVTGPVSLWDLVTNATLRYYF